MLKVICSVLLLLACDQGFNSGNIDTVPIHRAAADAQYTDGTYAFNFKNGSKIVADCDGYGHGLYSVGLKQAGKIIIYEYFKSDIDKWVKRLKDIGVNDVSVYKTSNPFNHCYVAFDENLLIGIGMENGTSLPFLFGHRMHIETNEGKKLDLQEISRAYYIYPHKPFDPGERELAAFMPKNITDRVFFLQDHSMPILFLGFFDGNEDTGNKLWELGLEIRLESDQDEIKKYGYIAVDASNIKSFTSDQRWF